MTAGRTLKRREALWGYALLAPSLVGVGAFLVLPILVIVWLSTQQWDLLGPPRPVGLANYVDVLGDEAFRHSLLISLFFIAVVVPLQTALGLGAASLLTRGLPGSGAFRVIFALPWIAAPLALGVVWRWILAPSNGLLNDLLGIRVEWLTTNGLALPVVAAVVVWSNVGYVTLFFAAGLLNIPEHLIEAARLDGASPTQVFWRIKMPLIRPTLFFVLVTSAISALQLFDQIFALTQGGPFRITDTAVLGETDVVAMRIYQEAFGSFEFGRASAMALVLFAVIIVITLAQRLYFRKRTTYDLS